MGLDRSGVDLAATDGGGGHTGFSRPTHGCKAADGAPQHAGRTVAAMARFALPHVLADLSYRIGHDDAVRNARVELDLAEQRIDAAEDLIRRVEAHARSAPAFAAA